MSSRPFDPTRLDVEAFAAEGAELDGRWPVTGFARVCESAAVECPPTDADSVFWRVRGERVPVRGGEYETWLHLSAETALALQCQRCLGPVQVPLAMQPRFRFVHGEDAAAALDAVSDDDVLAMSRALDLRELVEDELLLAMPLVPLHENCPAPLPLAPEEPDAGERENPFAALAGWKADRPLN